MGKDLIKVVYNDEPIFTVENPDVKKNIVERIMGFSAEISEVTLERPSDNTIRKAKKFELLKNEGLKFPAFGLFLLFPKGTEIYVYLD